MYYLNDQHSKYQYAIYCKVGDAMPYIKKVLDSIDDVKIYITEIEKRHNHYGQFFYIDNDFYDNKYPLGIRGTYYKVLRRTVADWEEFNFYENQNKNYDNVIDLYTRKRVNIN